MTYRHRLTIRLLDSVCPHCALLPFPLLQYSSINHWIKYKENTTIFAKNLIFSINLVHSKIIELFHIHLYTLSYQLLLSTVRMIANCQTDLMYIYCSTTTIYVIIITSVRLSLPRVLQSKHCCYLYANDIFTACLSHSVTCCDICLNHTNILIKCMLMTFHNLN